MSDTTLPGQPETGPITRVADLRFVPLGRLTRSDMRDATRLVLPGGTKQVAVAAFQSSI